MCGSTLELRLANSLRNRIDETLLGRFSSARPTCSPRPLSIIFGARWHSRLVPLERFLLRNVYSETQLAVHASLRPCRESGEARILSERGSSCCPTVTLQVCQQRPNLSHLEAPRSTSVTHFLRLSSPPSLSSQRRLVECAPLRLSVRFTRQRGGYPAPAASKRVTSDRG